MSGLINDKAIEKSICDCDIINEIIDFKKRRKLTMAMCKCGECGRQVSSTATVCPYCGRDVGELRARGFTCGYCVHDGDSDTGDCGYGYKLCLAFEESDYDLD